MSVRGILHWKTGEWKKKAIVLTMKEKDIHWIMRMHVIRFWKCELSPT